MEIESVNKKNNNMVYPDTVVIKEEHPSNETTAENYSPTDKADEHHDGVQLIGGTMSSKDNSHDIEVQSPRSKIVQHSVPHMAEIKGTREQKLQYINEKVKEWSNLKKQAEQIILSAGMNGTDSNPSNESGEIHPSDKKIVIDSSVNIHNNDSNKGYLRNSVGNTARYLQRRLSFQDSSQRSEV